MLFILLLAPVLIICSRINGMDKTKYNITSQESRATFYSIPMLLAAIAISSNYPWWCCAISYLLAFGGICLGHSFCEDNNERSFWEMGLVVWVRIALMILPFFLFNHMLAMVPFVACAMPMLCDVSYKITKPLILFKIQWATPGDSSYEDLARGFIIWLGWFLTYILSEFL